MCLTICLGALTGRQHLDLARDLVRTGRRHCPDSTHGLDVRHHEPLYRRQRACACRYPVRQRNRFNHHATPDLHSDRNGLAGAWHLSVSACSGRSPRYHCLCSFFRGARDIAREAGTGAEKPHHAAQTMGDLLRSTVLTRRFLQLLVAAFSIAVVIVPLVTTIVPVLSANGLGRGTAAKVASAIGIASITGRLCIGYLPSTGCPAELSLLSVSACRSQARRSCYCTPVPSQEPQPPSLSSGLRSGAELDIVRLPDLPLFQPRLPLAHCSG